MTNTPLPRKQLQQLAKLRLREAEALYATALYDGSVYLAGYAVELALKARICRLLDVTDYPLELGQTFRIDNLERLKVLAGLSAQIHPSKNKDLYNNWSKAIQWDPEQRYEAPGKHDAVSAKEVLDSLRAKPNGV